MLKWSPNGCHEYIAANFKFAYWCNISVRSSEVKPWKLIKVSTGELCSGTFNQEHINPFGVHVFLVKD